MPKKIIDLDVLAGTEEDVSLYLVPGISSRPPRNWALCSKNWLSFFTCFPDSIRIYGVHHGLDLGEAFLWQTLRENAARVLEELWEQSENASKAKPIIFVAHSLGAVLLKQALCIANIQSDKYHALLQKIVGVVFVGGPHDLADPDLLGDKVLSIFRCCSKTVIPKTEAASIKQQALELRDISIRYSNMNFQVPVLSVYETVATPVRDTRLSFKKQKNIIADQNLVTVHTRHEQTLGLPLTHLDICGLVDADQKPSDHAKQWFQQIIEQAVQNVQNRLRRYEDVLAHSADLASVTSLNVGRRIMHKIFDRMTVEDDTLEAQQGSTATDKELAPLIASFEGIRRDAKLPCFLMDTYTQNHDFFGRDDVLRRLDEILLPNKDLLFASQPQEYRHVVLCGMAGLGKTETAIQYAYTRRHEFDAIFWIRAEDDNKLETDFAQIASRLDLEDSDEMTPPVVARELAKGWLAQPSKLVKNGDITTREMATWLIIFDNADDPNTLIDYMEVCGSGSLLITSRNPLAQSTFSPSSVLINLEPFGESEGVQFLHRLTRNGSQPEAAARIAKHLDGLPLAMVQMAGIIRQQFLTYSEFLEQYFDGQEMEGDLYATEAQPFRQTARGNISSIWAIDSLDEEARSVLEVLSLLDPDCVQESILTDALTKDDLVLVKNFPRTKQAFINARKKLQQSSLIRRNDKRGEFWLHRVLQDAVRGKMSKDRMKEAFVSSIWLLLQAWPSSTLLDTHNVSRWGICEALFPHVLAIERIYSKTFKDTNVEGIEHLARLLSSATWWKHEQGESHAILGLLEVALEVCNKSLADDMRNLQYDIHYTLASVGDETNNAALCLQHSRIVLDMELKRGDTADVRLAQAHNQIGIAYMISKEYESAKQSFKTSLNCWQQVNGFHKGLLSIATANLGLAHWHLGELKEAEQVLQKGIKDREEQYGPMDTHSFRLGRLFHALGDVQEAAGNQSEAENTFRKALASHLSTIGNSHHRTADVCHKVGQHCLRKGQLAEALVLVNQALKIWSVDKKAYKPEIARTGFLKSKVLRAQGRTDEADQMRRLAIRQRKTLPNLTARQDDELEEKDFDELVAFWSK